MSRPELTEEELRALEAEMERISVDDVLLQTLVTLLNLGARKGGLGAPPGEEPGRDLDQMRTAIEGARALLPIVEPRHADKLGPVRDGLSQLQMAYAQLAGAGAPGAGAAPGGGAPGSGAPGQGGEPGRPGGEPEGPSGPGPAQRSGRLWVPGQ